MRSITIPRPSPALAVALIALFVALGGTGYAAAKLSGSSIKPASIPANRVVPNSLGGSQIDEAKLGVVPAAAASAKADEAKTLQGRAPAAFMAGAVRIATADTSEISGTGDGSPAEITVACTADEKAIGGGAAWLVPVLLSPSNLNTPLTATMPVVGASGEPTGWRALGRNLSGTTRVLRVYALCVPKSA